MPDTATVLVPSASKADRLNAATPGIPSVEFAYIAPFRLILVRTLRTFLQSLVGLLIAGMAGGTAGLIPFTDFQDLFVKSIGLAVAPAVIALIQNVIELLAKLDQSNPELRG